MLEFWDNRYHWRGILPEIWSSSTTVTTGKIYHHILLGMSFCSITLHWMVKNQGSGLYGKQVRQQSYSIIIMWHICVVCRMLIFCEKRQVHFIQWHCELLKLYSIGSKWINYWYIAFVECCGRGKAKFSEKTCPSATVATINPMWTGLWSNPGLHIERLVTNHMITWPFSWFL
jgi:hypothetical protein